MSPSPILIFLILAIVQKPIAQATVFVPNCSLPQISRILWQDQTFAELRRFYGIVRRLSFSAHGIFNISISPHVVLIATHPETNMGGLEGHGGDL
jgi:hypothetical protein